MSSFWEKFRSLYRIGEVPFFWWPIYFPVSFMLGVLVFFYFKILIWTCHLRFEGLENFQPDNSQIYAFWHFNSLPFLTFLPTFKNQILLHHPLWYMKCFHFAIRWNGVRKFVFGSSGHSGKESAQKIIDALKKGFSTGVTPDGPAGPAFKMKNGVFRFSFQSGAPIVGISVRCSHALRLPSWDRKILPLPFSTVEFRFGDPIQVNRERFDPFFPVLEKELSFYDCP